MSGVPSIRKLDDTVINRIAAGEVIQRPASAIKELLENSLDAKSTNIQITAKQGGLKFLQIQDNGTGIRKEDLSIVCERFTTSKLKTFEDLSGIGTYGFRGEALASISHVAHLTIVTKTADSLIGYKTSYEDGKAKGPPKPYATTDGTFITVEDLFYNIPTRRKALRSPNEEYAKIIDVVGKYAIHNHKVGFTLKKQGEITSDIKTNPSSTVIDNIRLIFGTAVAKDLLEIKSTDDMLKCEISGQISNVNYSNKKLIFLLFINNRLVDSSGLRKIIEQVYSVYLPKSSHPFVYISIKLDPQNVDVNVHPTKHEVHFLHEDRIIDKVKSVIEERLTGSNSSRTFYTQIKLPTLLSSDTILDSEPKSVENKKEYANKTVRTDSVEQKLDKFFCNPNKSKEVKDVKAGENLVSEKRVIKLKSIMQLCADVQNYLHTGLHDIIKNFTFVGFINVDQCLLQHDTKLYLCNTKKIVRELIYQIILYEFGNFGVIRFSEPVPLKDLILFYLELPESGWTEVDGPREDLAISMTDLLKEKAAMLDDYFSIEIDSDGSLHTLPLIIDKYVPNIGYLPNFLCRICTEVDWNLEKPCLEGISKELASFYSEINVDEEDVNADKPQWMWTVEHILLALVKKSLLPPSSFAQDGTILQIANLPDLYKVFERC